MQTFDIEKQKREESGDDYIFGALSQPGIVSIPPEERDAYFPQGEVQFSNRADFVDCATRNGPVEQLEALLNYHYLHGMKPENKQWLRDKGYILDGKIALSDRFSAILSGSTKRGNSLKAPYDSVHRDGVIPKSMLPKEDWMLWEDYHELSKITQEMKDLGREFARRFSIRYEKVHRDHFADLLKDEMIGVAAHAWDKPVNGVYLRHEGDYIHAFLLYKLPKFIARDSYYDFTDEGVQIKGDFTKTLAPDYDFYEWGYILKITAEATAEELAIQVSVFNELAKNGLLKFFAKFLDLFMNRVRGIGQQPWWLTLIKAIKRQLFIHEPLPPPRPTILSPDWKPAQTPKIEPVAPQPTTREKVYDYAKKCLNKDIAATQNELGCAESVSYVLKKVAVADFPAKGFLSTTDFNRWLAKYATRIDTPEFGDIIISPTGMSTKGAAHGHIGICGKQSIISNNSANGLFQDHLDRKTWDAYFGKKLGFPTFFYRLK